MKGRNKLKIIIISAAAAFCLLAGAAFLLRPQEIDLKPVQLEYLDRGTAAVKTDEGVFLSWRLLGTDNYGTAFSVYRDSELIYKTSDATCFTDEEGTESSTYRVVAPGEDPQDVRSVSVLSDQMMRIPLDPPEEGVSKDGEAYTYTANDASCADVDGDGRYEIILKWEPSNSFDSGEEARHTGNVFIDAYTLDGERLWRMDLGCNISAGAHFTQIAAYDLDMDGKAELAFKTAPGSRDGTGKYVSEASDDEEIQGTDNHADLRHLESGEDSGGRVMSGEEFFTVFRGDTGAAIDTIYYPFPRGTVSEWGDDRGNRSERYLTAVAYLDGTRPSVIAWRGYYDKMTAAAYDLEDGRLVLKADFDTSGFNMGKYEGQGNHNLTVGDADGDGRDELFCGSLVLDDDLTPLWCSFRGHGDAQHLADYDPLHPGMEYFCVHESKPFGMTLYDAATGEELFHRDSETDTGRGMMANVGYADGYFQIWGRDAGTFTSLGEKEVEAASYPAIPDNFRIFWDGDLYDDMLDGSGGDTEENAPVKITGRNGELTVLPDGRTNNGTKNNVCLTADLFGDWREEIAVRGSDGRSLLIYTTVIPTEQRLYTLMHDRTYRMQVVSQNAGYNQPPHIGYYVSGEKDPRDERERAAYIRTVYQGNESLRTKNLP